MPPVADARGPVETRSGVVARGVAAAPCLVPCGEVDAGRRRWARVSAAVSAGVAAAGRTTRLPVSAPPVGPGGGGDVRILVKCHAMPRPSAPGWGWDGEP